MKIALALMTVLLVATPTAAAKGVASAEVCGTGGCRALDAHGALDLDNLIPFGTPVGGPRRLPFYRLRLAFEGRDISLVEHRGEDPSQVTDVIYMPAAGVARLARPTGRGPSRGEAWSALARPSMRAFRLATAGLEPLPAAELERAAIRPTAETADPSAQDGAGEAAVPAAGGALALLALAGAALLARRGRGSRRARTRPRHRLGREQNSP